VHRGYTESSMSYEDLLARAAQAYGIELHYTDTWGHVHQTAPEVLRALLSLLGFSAASSEDIERELAARDAAKWRRPIDPTVVLREDADYLRVNIPMGRSGASLKLEIEWENGNLEHHWFWLPQLTTVETAAVEGSEWIAKHVPLPKPLLLGYHHIRLLWIQEPELEPFGQARFIVCPRQAKSTTQRMAGLALSLYGLRSRRNWGCGDFTDLEGVIDILAPSGASFVALNPLHAIANRQPYNTSPYLPQCAFFRNFIYLDVERVGNPQLNSAMRREIEDLRASQFVEYERVAQLKLTALGRIFELFLEDRGPAQLKRGEFDEYSEWQGQLLQDYATYCALDEEMHRRDPDVWLWTDWPEEYRDPRSAATREFAQKHRERILFFKFLQWQIQVQASAAHARALAKGMRLGLYHDLALATDKYGADLWALRPFYLSGARVGAPPDELAPSGQDWGFPPPHREEHRGNGYQLFAQSIRNAAACGGALRIDHVMRFLRLFTIPEGFETSQGTYLQDYAQDLLGILALESVRGKFVVIGEDLGTVTGEARAALAAAGILSYRVLWFERDGAGNFNPPESYPERALVSTTTHDLPTLAGFAETRDLEARRAAGLADESEYQQQKAHRAGEVLRLREALERAGFPGDPLGFVLSTPCLLAVVNQEDLSGETEQQNLPGSTWQYPNWRRKMRIPVEEFAALADQFATLAKRSRRVSD
jgi:4-alpha-glucanotransferase